LLFALVVAVFYLVTQALMGDMRGSDWGSLWALLYGTCSIAFFAVAIALPFGLAGAFVSTLYLPSTTRRRVGQILSGLSAVPMVALGFVIGTSVAPFLSQTLAWPALHPLYASLAMALGIFPWVWLRIQQMLEDLPDSWWEGSMALGCSTREFLVHIALPASLPRLAGCILRAFGRACGETAVVLLVSGSAQSVWGGSAAGATIGGALVTLMPEVTLYSPESVFLHRAALMLLLVTLCIQVIQEQLRIGRRRV
jgi:phosphate transport system permease protein